MTLNESLASRRSIREYAPEPLPLASAAELLWAAQGVTDTDGGRTAPSAGALYPLEILLVAGEVTDLPPGVYRYVPARHEISLIANGDRRAALADAALDQEWMRAAPAIVAVTAVSARTARKYGERAERYVHIEVGHAVENIYLEATALGLGTCVVGAFDDAAVGRALALPAGEAPLALMPVGRRR
jgi:SagB-type dehydrogenase family enzyme